MIGNIRRKEAVTVVEIEGRLDAVSAPAVKSQLHELIEKGNRNLILDLHGIAFIDSAGLGTLVSCLRRCTAEGGDLRLAAVPAFCRSIFELTRLTRVFDVFEDEEQAMAAFSQDSD